MRKVLKKSIWKIMKLRPNFEDRYQQISTDKGVICKNSTKDFTYMEISYMIVRLE